MKKKLILFILCIASLTMLSIDSVSASGNFQDELSPRIVTMEKTNIAFSGNFENAGVFSFTVRVTYKFEDNGNGQIIAIMGTEVINKDGDEFFDVLECTASKVDRHAIHVRVKIRSGLYNDIWTGSVTKVV